MQWGALYAWPNVSQLMSCNYVVGPWFSFIFCLPYDGPTKIIINQGAFDYASCTNPVKVLQWERGGEKQRERLNCIVVVTLSDATWSHTASHLSSSRPAIFVDLSFSITHNLTGGNHSNNHVYNHLNTQLDRYKQSHNYICVSTFTCRYHKNWRQTGRGRERYYVTLAHPAAIHIHSHIRGFPEWKTQMKPWQNCLLPILF